MRFFLVHKNNDKNLDDEIKDCQSVELGANLSLPADGSAAGSLGDVSVVTDREAVSLVISATEILMFTYDINFVTKSLLVRHYIANHKDKQS